MFLFCVYERDRVTERQKRYTLRQEDFERLRDRRREGLREIFGDKQGQRVALSSPLAALPG
jgi:hypothetical protein